MGIIDKKDLEQMLNSIITALSGVLKVDALSTEDTAITTRGVTINTDSTAGEIAVKFANSGELIYKIYVGKFKGQAGIGLNKKGAVDEPVVVEWSGVDTGAKIFVALTYKEE